VGNDFNFSQFFGIFSGHSWWLTRVFLGVPLCLCTFLGAGSISFLPSSIVFLIGSFLIGASNVFPPPPDHPLAGPASICSCGLPAALLFCRCILPSFPCSVRADPTGLRCPVDRAGSLCSQLPLMVLFLMFMEARLLRIFPLLVAAAVLGGLVIGGWALLLFRCRPAGIRYVGLQRGSLLLNLLSSLGRPCPLPLY
jgi:hypothetical protein